jgi:autotransporter-associated beta strand protein
LTLSGPVNLSSNANNNTLTVGGAGNTSISGAIANGGTSTASILTMSGSGTLGLSGANTYAGGTNVNSGVVSVSGAAGTLGAGAVTVLGTTAGTALLIQSGVTNAIADTATLSLLGGGTAGVPDQGYADLGTGINELVASLVLGGVVQSGGTYGGTGSSAAHILPDYFAPDTGIITVPSSCAPGDLNCDGHNDAGDYVFWRKNGGTPGDANYTAWRSSFGTPPGSGSGGGLGANGGTVPEPSSIALLMLGLVAVAAPRRQR